MLQSLELPYGSLLFVAWRAFLSFLRCVQTVVCSYPSVTMSTQECEQSKFTSAERLNIPQWRMPADGWLDGSPDGSCSVS